MSLNMMSSVDIPETRRQEAAQARQEEKRQREERRSVAMGEK